MPFTRSGSKVPGILQGAEELKPDMRVTLRVLLLAGAGVAGTAVMTAMAATPTATRNLCGHTSAANGDAGWPMFNQTFDAQRYSSLQQITASNAG